MADRASFENGCSGRFGSRFDSHLEPGTEGPVDVDVHCDAAMDRLLARQKAIERTLAQRHLKEGRLVLYGYRDRRFFFLKLYNLHRSRQELVG